VLAVGFVLDVIQLIKIASDDNPFKIMTLIGIVVSLIAFVFAVWYILAKYTKKAAEFYKIFIADRKHSGYRNRNHKWSL